MADEKKLLLRELKAWKRDFDALADSFEDLEERCNALSDKPPAPPAPKPEDRPAL